MMVRRRKPWQTSNKIDKKMNNSIHLDVISGNDEKSQKNNNNFVTRVNSLATSADLSKQYLKIKIKLNYL